MDEWTILDEPVAGRVFWRDGSEWTVGLVLRDSDGREALVGDVNAAGGVCNCCFFGGDVAAYRRVWGDGSGDAELFASLAAGRPTEGAGHGNL